MLPAGVDWRPSLGEHTRPVGEETPHDAATLPDQPRRAADGTPYCVACPRSLRSNPRSQRVLCTGCGQEREAHRARKYRRRLRESTQRAQAAAPHISLAVEGASDHLEAISNLQSAVLAVAARRRSLSQEWTDALLAAAKRVDVSADFLRSALDRSEAGHADEQ